MRLRKDARRLGDAAAGRITEETVAQLATCSTRADIIIDGAKLLLQRRYRRAKSC